MRRHARLFALLLTGLPPRRDALRFDLSTSPSLRALAEGARSADAEEKPHRQGSGAKQASRKQHSVGAPSHRKPARRSSRTRAGRSSKRQAARRSSRGKHDATTPRDTHGVSFPTLEIERVGKEVAKWSERKCDEALRRLASRPQGVKRIGLALVDPAGSNATDFMEHLARKKIDPKGFIAHAVTLPPTDEDEMLVAQVIANGWGNLQVTLAQHQSKARVICAGGDATAAWCLTVVVGVLLSLGGATDGGSPELAVTLALEVDKMRRFIPVFIMCPMTTGDRGNELSRSLGWGAKYPGEEGEGALKEWLSKARKSMVLPFDVWTLQFASELGCTSPAFLPQPGLAADARNLMLAYMTVGSTALAMAIPSLHTSGAPLAKMITGAVVADRHFSEDLGVRCPVGCSAVDPELKRGNDFLVANVAPSFGSKSLWEEGAFQSITYDGELELKAIDVPLAESVDALEEPRSMGSASDIQLTWTSRPLSPDWPEPGETKGRYFQVDGRTVQCAGPGGLLIKLSGPIRVAMGPFPHQP